MKLTIKLINFKFLCAFMCACAPVGTNIDLLLTQLDIMLWTKLLFTCPTAADHSNIYSLDCKTGVNCRVDLLHTNDQKCKTF